MDPFSLATGVVGVLGVTIQLSQIVITYIHSTKNATKAASDLSASLTILESTLKSLDIFLRSENAKNNSFEHTSVLCCASVSCKARLDVLYNKLSKHSANRMIRAIEYLKWPFNEGENRTTVTDLQGFIQTFQFSMTIDGCALLSKTSDEVSSMLKTQLETFKRLGEIPNYFSTLSINVSKESEQVSQILHIVASLSDSSMELHNISGGIQRAEHKLEGHIQEQEDQAVTKKREDLSLVIDQLRRTFAGQDVAVAFFYFDYRSQDYQTPANVIASLLKQIVAQSSILPPSASELYEKFKKQRDCPQFQELQNTPLLVLRDFSRLFLVIDALDECDAKKHRKPFLKVLKDLESTSAKVFVTSRPHPDDIKKSLCSCPKIKVEASDEDIRKYLAHKIEQDGDTDLIDEKLKDEIVSSITNGARGMFLLPALQIQTILDQTTKTKMRRALKEMPKELDTTLKATLGRIEQQPPTRAELSKRTLIFPKDQSGLHIASIFGLDALIAPLLSSPGAEPDSKDSLNRTALSYAAQNCDLTVVQQLLDCDGVQPDAKDSYGRTILSYAAEHGHEVVVQLLLGHEDVDPGSKDNKGGTPLWYAASNGHEVVVRLLLEKADDVDLTHLSVAVKNKHDAAVELLLEKPVDLNCVDPDYGLTPLSFGCVE
ncbi:hypothetical protein EG329_008728 [Mollisiaceae sp. DMI_Dod_QoI]|nr:hypothetical protein EG329_008728 [Helotiales sp. DMI_Dod_QoI]